MSGLSSAFRQPALWISLALIATVLEGAVRKWVPGFGSGAGQLVAYFSKDILFAIGCLMLITKASYLSPALIQFSNWQKVACGLIILGGLVSMISGFNAVGSALTLRALWALPLMALLFAQRNSSFPLLAIASVLVLLTLINLPLSLLQNSLPSSHILNRYVSDSMHIVEVDHGVRATGTFAYITGLGVLSAAGMWAALVVLSIGNQRKHMVLGVLGVVAALGCAFATISRGAVVVALVMLGLWALGSAKTTRIMVRTSIYAGIITLIALLTVPGMTDRFLHVADGAFDRFSSAGDSNIDRTFGQWTELGYAIERHPFGLGLGTEQIGGNVAATGVAGFTNYESQFPRIVAELGVIGLLGFFLLVGGTVLALQQAKRDRPYGGFPMAMTATQLFFLSQCYTSLMVNHTASAFAWLAVAASLAAASSTTTTFATQQTRRGWNLYKKKRRKRVTISSPQPDAVPSE